MSACITYGKELIFYELLFLDTRKTMTIEVHPDGRVVVKAPEGCSHDDIAGRLHRRAGWISRKLEEFRAYSPRTPARQYLGGETHLYLGKQYRLQVFKGDPPAVKLQAGKIQIAVKTAGHREAVKSLLDDWYRSRAKIIFNEILLKNISHFKGFEVPGIKMRAMKTRWGSLSPRGIMSLNISLIKAPRQCIEYVVVHELCHLPHPQHDKAFYHMLAKILPDWEARKKKLERFLL
jgi:hypothetical protein